MAIDWLLLLSPGEATASASDCRSIIELKMIMLTC